ncbi:hypothetical protein OG500_18305 [Kitasatospora sp. NBC_01250]|nr:hypothetical protein [Kitasatospora sp. NBC_01250]
MRPAHHAPRATGQDHLGIAASVLVSPLLAAVEAVPTRSPGSSA